MKKIILIMGLSGNGKTTFYNNIKESLKDHLYLNADIVRKEYDDWDFSISGRIRQAQRMKDLSEKSEQSLVVIDMICPLKEMRNIIKPDIIFFINRKENSKYIDTDTIFEAPSENECEILYTIKSNE
jgi:adenylylsulfate kinase-like enzyme